MRKKRILSSILFLLCGTALVWLILVSPLHAHSAAKAGPSARFRTSGKVIQQMQDGQWQDFEVKGINVGTGYPGLFPNESGITQETYYRWFQQIGEMNANTIRVYKLQSPAFYAAFARYNREHEEKLYLIQGVDFPEPLVFSEKNLLDEPVHRELFRDTRRVVDALHGDSITLSHKENQLNCFTHDVSPYVLGYILGIEWDELFVEYVCRLNKHINSFTGSYLRCPVGSNAFEVFLAQWGEDLLSYETKRYGVQPLVSFCNWPDTDPFKNELPPLSASKYPDQARMETPVDIDHIQPEKNTVSGVFASYNVYPYFPAFLQYGPYTEQTEADGSKNPYYFYLKALTDHHRCPVIISEYGIPSSRSRAYGELWHGFHHGGLSETEQGEAMVELLGDIRRAGCAGSIAFTWQDEWYKTIWNERLISDPDYRAFWSNAQCAEQFFGVLAFEPGNAGETPYPDGDLSEWSEKDLVWSRDQLALSMQYDEKYVYFLVDGLDSRPDNSRVSIALDVTPKSGRTTVKNHTFGRPVDFIIQISPNEEDCAIFVDNDYDLLPYSALGGYHDTTLSIMGNIQSDIARPGNSAIGMGQFYIAARADGDVLHRLKARWIINEVGRLRQGSGNPESPEYDSNADYFLSGDTMELRIPWQLLNFTDPSNCRIASLASADDPALGDLEISRVYAAAYYDDDSEITDFGVCKLKGWKKPAFHERLKQSYFILQKAFGGES